MCRVKDGAHGQWAPFWGGPAPPAAAAEPEAGRRGPRAGGGERPRPGRAEGAGRAEGTGGPGERTAGQVCVGQEQTAGCRAPAPEADCFSRAGRGTRRIRGWLSRF